MADLEEKLIKAIKHYQESLERNTKTGNTDKLLHCIEKLGRLSIKVCHLEQTGVGRTVNGLKRFDGPVGESARNLVDKWKLIVKGEEEEEKRQQEKEKTELETTMAVSENSDSDSSSKKIKKSKYSEKRRSRSRDRKSSSSSKRKSSRKSSTEDSDSDSKKKKKKKSSKRSESSESSDSSSDRRKPHKSSSRDKTSHKDLKSKERHSSPEKKKKREDTPEKHQSKDKKSKRDESTEKHHSKDKKRKREVSPEVQETKKHKKEHSDKSKERKSEKSSSKSSKPTSPAAVASTSKKSVSTQKLVNGIDSESGASFADVLNMLGSTPVVKTNKKRVSAPETVEKPVSKPAKEKESSRSSSMSMSYQEPRTQVSNDEEVPDLLKRNPSNLEPLDINLSSLLPSITPNYRPLNAPLDGQNRKLWTDDEALSRVISAKHQRTKVYSGVKCGYTKVPTLFEICSRVLQDNLDALEYTGGVPYSILKPILEKANPDQLYQLEFHNPYLMDDSDELWQLHCHKEFRNKKREELETWRDMYMRCLDEREAKLKALTANIKHSQDTSMPVRQTKLAYVDSFVKPPRNIARKQAKNGTAMAAMKKPSQTPSERLSLLAKSGEAGKTAVPNPGKAAVERPAYTPSNLKPKKAPLMAKTLSLLKNRFGRR
ncbi:transcription elongation factor B polypeptide 3 [Anthonomus grandis grandis]|uniref:transcription elongation factor B polypeptide 3 n=1 Tax=Anthonomus grandis grandis TaxID=2921223 RepID=UPI002166A68B|nr:transcription elongation factor B polypeptide 3 [Anthonomus grandis grandis]